MAHLKVAATKPRSVAKTNAREVAPRAALVRDDNVEKTARIAPEGRDFTHALPPEPRRVLDLGPASEVNPLRCLLSCYEVSVAGSLLRCSRYRRISS